MPTAGGAGVEIKSLAFKGPSIVYACLLREAGGTLDADGFELHLLYRGTRPNNGDDAPIRDGLPAQFEVLLDGGNLVLPWGGSIAVIGGAGEWSFDLYAEPFCGHHVPRPYALSVRLQGDGWYTVPRWHHEIGSSNGSIVMETSDLEEMLLDGVPRPIRPGTRVRSKAHLPTRIFTRVWL